MPKHLIPRPTHANMKKRRGGHYNIIRRGLRNVTGSNKYCGPAVVAAMTGCKTNQASLLIKSVNPSRYLSNVRDDAHANCGIVYREDLIETLKWCGFLYTGEYAINANGIETLGDFCRFNTMGALPTNTYFLVRTSNHWVVIFNGKLIDNNWLGFSKHNITKGPRSTRSPTACLQYITAKHRVKSIDTFHVTDDVDIEVPPLPVVDPRIGKEVSLFNFFIEKSNGNAAMCMQVFISMMHKLHRKTGAPYVFSERSTFGMFAHEMLDSVGHHPMYNNAMDQVFMMFFFDLMDSVITPALAYNITSKPFDTQYNDRFIEQVTGTFYDKFTSKLPDCDEDDLRDWPKGPHWLVVLYSSLIVVINPTRYSNDRLTDAHQDIKFYRSNAEQLRRDLQYFKLTFHRDRRVEKLGMHKYILNKPEVVYSK